MLLVSLAGWGLTGAALATTTANVLGMAALLIGMRHRGKVGMLLDEGSSLRFPSGRLAVEKSTHCHLQLRPVFQVPRRADIEALMSTLAPLTLSLVAKNLCYIQIQTTAASILTVTSLAAHQALFSAWGFCSFLVG